jgi:hypothetical protein
MRPLASVLVVLALGWWAEPVRSDTGPARETLCERLKHQEGLVYSLECEYEHRILETRPELIPLIRQVRGKEAERCIITRQHSDAMSRAVKFWRKGPKERMESASLAPESLGEKRSVSAFDGQIVRSVSYRKDDITASIATAETAYWDRMPAFDPMGFLYRYYEIPYSEVIATASTYSSTVITRGTSRFFLVSIRCSGRLSNDVLDFTFDDRYLPVERVQKLKLDDGRLLPFHKLLFSQYKSYPTASGETVWFPDHVEYIGYTGVTPQGEPLEAHREEFPIHSIRFNTDIPDQLFELEIPQNAKVNDKLTGLGWLPPGVRPAALFPAEAARRRWWLTAGIVLAALAVVAVGVVVARRRRAAAQANAHRGGIRHDSPSA